MSQLLYAVQDTQVEPWEDLTQYTDYATQFIIQVLYSVQDTQVEKCKYLPHYTDYGAWPCCL